MLVKWKILTSTQNKHKPTLKTADSGCNLTDDRSHKIQYNDRQCVLKVRSKA